MKWAGSIRYQTKSKSNGYSGDHICEKFSASQFPDDIGRVVNAQLHHFSDASVKGYDQCSYLRLVNENQRVHCSEWHR